MSDSYPNGGIPEIYSNVARVNTGLYDVVLTLGLLTPPGVEEYLPVAADVDADGEEPEPMARIDTVGWLRMPFGHAKSIAVLMLKQITDFEENNDLEIPMPEHVVKDWEELRMKLGGRNEEKDDAATHS